MTRGLKLVPAPGIREPFALVKDIDGIDPGGWHTETWSISRPVTGLAARAAVHLAHGALGKAARSLPVVGRLLGRRDERVLRAARTRVRVSCRVETWSHAGTQIVARVVNENAFPIRARLLVEGSFGA